MKNKENTGIFDKIWNLFASVKLAVILLILLALTSIVGTIVEQRADQAKNIKLLAKFFGDETAPTVYNLFANLGFMDMYRSWWFIGLLVLFCVNLIICSLERFPKTLRLINAPIRPLGEEAIKKLPIKKELNIKTDVKTAQDVVTNSLSASRYRVLGETIEGSVQLYTQKWAYTRFGVYFVHLSILMIFIGAIIGVLFGYEGFINLPEGRTTSFISTWEGGEPIPLDFTIKCNWYDTDYYYGTDTPQEFKSELVVIEDGREVLTKVIEVNSPLKYKGITFYQSSFGMVPGAVGEFVFNVIPDGGQARELRLIMGESFEIPGSRIKGTIVDFSPAIGRDPKTGVLTTYSDNMSNPAVAIDFEVPGKENFTGWILRRYPETGTLPDGSQIKFVDYWGVEFTGLQVSKDPGVWLIYLASIIMTLGLYAAFFMNHKKIWVDISPQSARDKGLVKISFGGTANKNRLSMEREMEHLVSKVSRMIEEKNSVKK